MGQPRRADIEFGKLLRRARDDAGLSSEYLADQLFVKRETVDRYMRGDRRPSKELVAMWERICGVESGALLAVYSALPPKGASSSDNTQVTEVEPPETSKKRVDPPPPPVPTLGVRRWRPALWGPLAVGLVLVALAVVGFSSWIDDPVSRPSGVVLRVDNRITSGMQVQEDPNRVPLSTRPVPNCGSRGCEVKDSPTWESKQQIDRAVCQQRGERITNGHDASEADDKNPLLDASSLYYGVVLKDDTRGYIAEVWVAREQRGGLGLPPCSRVLPDLARR